MTAFCACVPAGRHMVCVTSVGACVGGTRFYRCPLRERLPVIRIPLRRGERDAALDRASAGGPKLRARQYARKIDYTKPPEPPLPRMTGLGRATFRLRLPDDSDYCPTSRKNFAPHPPRFVGVDWSWFVGPRTTDGSRGLALNPEPLRSS